LPGALGRRAFQDLRSVSSRHRSALHSSAPAPPAATGNADRGVRADRAGLLGFGNCGARWDWAPNFGRSCRAAIGVPLGVTLLTGRSAQRAPSGSNFPGSYSLYAFFRPALKPGYRAGAAADAGVGISERCSRRITGLAAFWSRYGLACAAGQDVQRAIFSRMRLHLSDERALAWRQGNRHTGRLNYSDRSGPFLLAGKHGWAFDFLDESTKPMVREKSSSPCCSFQVRVNHLRTH